MKEFSSEYITNQFDRQSHQFSETEKERVILTGGTEGIGRAITEYLIDEHHPIALCARTKERLDSFGADSRSVFTHQTDLVDRRQTRTFAHEAEDELKGCDLLILNAAVTGIRESAEDVFRINAVAPVALTRELEGSLCENHGRIVFVSSAAKNLEGVENYGQSKARMEAWLGEYGHRPGNEVIDIFSVIPGSCDTRMHQEVLDYGQGEVHNRTQHLVQAGMLRDPRVIGRIIAKMALTGKQFNSETHAYDKPIDRYTVVTISDENVDFEQREGYD